MPEIELKGDAGLKVLAQGLFAAAAMIGILAGGGSKATDTAWVYGDRMAEEWMRRARRAGEEKNDEHNG